MDNFPKLPDEIIEHVRQIVEDSEGSQWELGDYLVEVVDELSVFYANTQPGEVTDRVVRQARASIVRQIADGVGIDRSTVRDRESMARFYPQDIRKLYVPLTYHQLRACKSAGEHWQEHAEWALSNLPAPVAVIRARVQQNGHDEPRWVRAWARMLASAHSILRNAEVHGDVPECIVSAAQSVVFASEELPKVEDIEGGE